jgi:hypothetical protein
LTLLDENTPAPTKSTAGNRTRRAAEHIKNLLFMKKITTM